MDKIKNTYLLANSAIKHQLSGDTTRHTNRLRHGRVSVGSTILAESRSPSLLLTGGMLDLELMLQHDEVALTGAILHLLLEGGAEGIKRVSTGDGNLIGENADPAQTSENTIPVLIGSKRGLGRNRPLQILLRGRGSAEDLLSGILPGHGFLQVVGGLVAEEAHVDEGLDHRGEALVAQGSADDGLGLGDAVALAEGGGVAVGVRDEGEARVDEVGFGGGHEVGARDADFLTVLVHLGGVAESQEHAAAGPREFVAQRVVGAFRGGETAAVGEEAGDFAALGVDLFAGISILLFSFCFMEWETYLGDGLNGIEMVNARIKANFVHNGDARLLAVFLELQHSRRDVGGSHDVRLGADTGLDDQGVEGVRDQGDGQVDLFQGLVEGGIIVNVEGDGLGVFEALAELLGAFEGAASFGFVRLAWLA